MSVVSLFHRFIGPALTGAEGIPRYAEASTLPIEQRYWAEPVDSWLRRRRWARHFDPAIALEGASGIVHLTDGGAHAAVVLPDGRALWTVWATMKFPAQIGVAAIQSFLAEHHYWAPNYPDHVLPLLKEVSTGADRSVREILAQALPNAVAHLAESFEQAVFDQRLAVFGALRTDWLPQGERLRSLLDVDPPAGMEAPAAWTRNWLTGRVYRRWECRGVLWGFTHHSGFVLHPGHTWMEHLCRPPADPGGPRNGGAYFDLALIAFTEVALEVLARSDTLVAATENDTVSLAVAANDLLRRLRSAFPTPIDQGRELLSIWRQACRRDLDPNRTVEGEPGASPSDWSLPGN